MSQSLPTLAEEAERIKAERGYYIHPYKLNEMMKVANKILNVLTSSTFQCTYADCRFILELVQSALNVGSGGCRRKDDMGGELTC